MSIVTKPATDLPWHVDFGSVWAGNLVQVTRRSLNENIRPVECDENNEYIVTAANYFPKLLAALSEITDRYDHAERVYFSQTGQVADGPNGTIERARNLLAELGVK